MKFKTCPAFKVASSEDDATFEAIVSVFGNVDSAGDVVMPGAFTDTIAHWKASGDPLPVLWSHRMDDPRFSIGSVADIAELEPGDPRIPQWAGDWLKAHGGLWVKGRLDTGPDASDVAIAARRLLKDRRVKQFSYAYDVENAGWETVNGQDAYALKTLTLYEISPTQVGCNNLTELVGAKASALLTHVSDSDGDRMRRMLSDMDTEELRQVYAVVGKALTERKAESTDTAPRVTDKSDEPEPVKLDDSPFSDGSMGLLSQLIIEDLDGLSHG